MKPNIAMLRKQRRAAGSSSATSTRPCLAHLPAEIRPVITFAYITGWRIASRGVAARMAAGGFRGRRGAARRRHDEERRGTRIPDDDDLRAVLKAQHAEHERLKKAGHILPVGVLSRGGRGARRREEAEADHQLQQGVEEGVSRGGLSRSHPARPAADGRAEPGAGRHPRARGDEDDRPQDAERVSSATTSSAMATCGRRRTS